MSIALTWFRQRRDVISVLTWQTDECKEAIPGTVSSWHHYPNFLKINFVLPSEKEQFIHSFSYKWNKFMVNKLTDHFNYSIYLLTIYVELASVNFLLSLCIKWIRPSLAPTLLYAVMGFGKHNLRSLVRELLACDKHNPVAIPFSHSRCMPWVYRHSIPWAGVTNSMNTKHASNASLLPRLPTYDIMDPMVSWQWDWTFASSTDTSAETPYCSLACNHRLSPWSTRLQTLRIRLVLQILS